MEGGRWGEKERERGRERKTKRGTERKLAREREREGRREREGEDGASWREGSRKGAVKCQSARLRLSFSLKVHSAAECAAGLNFPDETWRVAGRLTAPFRPVAGPELGLWF